MFALHTLKPLVKKRKRIGRGGSRGGTSGRGHKGQRARSGSTIDVAFEGGQMPLYRRLPKRGFTNARFKKDVKIISLQRLEHHFADGDTVTKELLVEKGIINIKKSGGPTLLKVLGNGKLTKKLTVTADAFSASALQAITQAGGQGQLRKER